MPQYSVVAIVGRPNVGKSTLFNRIVRERKAVVEATPGITRDRIYAEFEWAGRTMLLVDTGGLVLADADELVNLVRAQAEYAIAEADVIILLVDSRSGVTPDDAEIADVLRKAAKPVIAVAAKVDSERLESHGAEVHILGFDRALMVSALHGRGVADLLDAVVEELGEASKSAESEEAEPESEPIRIAVVGRPNVGKSSLVNALVGFDRAITSEAPGTTRDAVDTALVRDSDRFVLVDTAGIRRRGKIQGSVEFYCVLRAERAIERAAVACVVLDASEGLTDGDKRIAGLVKDSGTGCIIAANKWDLIEAAAPPGSDPKAAKAEFAQNAHTKMPYAAFAPVCCCSATERAGTEQILELAKTAAENRSLRVQTSEINRVIREACAARPYSRKGKELKIKYATMARVRPPTIVLFVNDPKILHFSYLRYLENRIRERYGFVGTPIRLVVRESAGQAEKDAG